MAEKQNRYWLGDSKKKYRKYQQEFVKKTYTCFIMRFHNSHDAEIIKELELLKNKTAYVRGLVNADLNGPRMIDKYDKKAKGTWVVDEPAWTETVHHPEKGHWEVTDDMEKGENFSQET